MPEIARVVVADDHPIYREGLARVLSDDPAVAVVGQATDADAAVALAERERPDVVLLDLSMPGGGGLAALPRLLALDPAPKVAVLTVSEEDDDVLRALRGGASGYILKGVGGGDLAAIVKSIAAGESYVTPLLAARILTALQSGGGGSAPDPLAQLTERETAILRLVAEGHPNKEVARRLDLQEKTVKHHMTSILQKLQARNRTEAALIARDRWGA